MSVPLRQAKIHFFRMLPRVVCRGVLVLLEEDSVRDLLGAIEVESSVLSQWLAVLRRWVVRSAGDGSGVVCELPGGAVRQSLPGARRVLTEVRAERAELLGVVRGSGVVS
ncbi:transcriptional regulator [Streptomyces sp. SCSIO 30461]|uniref:transcriptional regulator n=1 Tax=Streptomyces sp. SCSIO 30461 TaxID=3118085 RepID=UPI0030D40F54